MEKEIFFSIEETEDGGFVAESPEYAIRTEADNLEEVVRSVHYVLLSEFDEADRPTRIDLQFPDDER